MVIRTLITWNLGRIPPNVPATLLRAGYQVYGTGKTFHPNRPVNNDLPRSWTSYDQGADLRNMVRARITNARRHRACLFVRALFWPLSSFVCLYAESPHHDHKPHRKPQEDIGFICWSGLRIATTGVRRSRPSTTSPSDVRTTLATFVVTALPTETWQITFSGQPSSYSCRLLLVVLSL